MWCCGEFFLKQLFIAYALGVAQLILLLQVVDSQSPADEVTIETGLDARFRILWRSAMSFCCPSKLDHSCGIQYL
jgi:hypothetical protein